ncbi:unnamed protein product, partial [Ixodes pacificus]
LVLEGAAEVILIAETFVRGGQPCGQVAASERRRRAPAAAHGTRRARESDWHALTHQTQHRTTDEPSKSTGRRSVRTGRHGHSGNGSPRARRQDKPPKSTRTGRMQASSSHSVGARTEAAPAADPPSPAFRASTSRKGAGRRVFPAPVPLAARRRRKKTAWKTKRASSADSSLGCELPTTRKPVDVQVFPLAAGL